MEERQRRTETLALMERSMAQIDAARTRPAKQALREIAAELGLNLDR